MWRLLVMCLLTSAVHAENVICIGDSITQGGARAQEYTYRLPLQDMLKADFIGTRHTGLDPNIEWPEGFDPDHEGYYGETTAQVRDHLVRTLGQLPPPDIALIYLGTNDEFGKTVEPLRAIIWELRSRNAKVRVLVGLLPRGGWRGLYTRLSIRMLAHRLSVDVVQHTYSLSDTFDGVHPNRVGQQKMAAAWFAALNKP